MSAVVTGIIWSILSPTNADRRAIEQLNDSICGPRCVQRVLAHYGIDADLVDLVRELQWPAFESGTSFADLATALRQRGISTRIVRMRRLGTLTSSQPAIACVASVASGRAEHFVVLETREGEVVIWDGLNGYAPIGSQVANAPVILTSARPFEKQSLSSLRAAAALLCVIGTGVLLYRRWLQSILPSSTEWRRRAESDRFESASFRPESASQLASWFHNQR